MPAPTFDKINPLLHIVDTDPVPEPVISTSAWYKTEYADDITETALPWMQSQGWSVRTSITDAEDVTIYTMDRRKLQPEIALYSLIYSFTKAYNEGRSINDQRYDEIVTIYNVMLDKSEDYLGEINTSNDAYTLLIETLVTNRDADYDSHKTDVENVLDSYGDSQRTRINNSFDAKLATTKTNMINRGVYNTTTWDSIDNSIERERQIALGDIEDKIIQQDLRNKHMLYEQKSNVRQNIFAARDRLYDSQRRGQLGVIEMRNKIVESMLAFMERRTDDYPSLENLAGMASQLGMGETVGVSP